MTDPKPSVKRFRVRGTVGPDRTGHVEEYWQFKVFVELDRGAPRKYEKVDVFVRFAELDLASLARGQPDVPPFLASAQGFARYVVLSQIPEVIAIKGDLERQLFDVGRDQADRLALIDTRRIASTEDWIDLVPQGRNESPNIFICHAEADKTVAITLRDYLRDSDSEVNVFVASHPHSLPGGRDWWNTILANLRSSNLVLSIYSSRSKDRPWLYFESGGAHLRETEVIPLVVPPEPKAIPLPLGAIQGYALNDAADVKALVQQIAHRFAVQFRRSHDALQGSLAADIARLEREHTDPRAPASVDFRFSAIKTSRELHRYELRATVTLHTPPDQGSCQLVLLWPQVIRIVKLIGFEEGPGRSIEGVEYREFSLESTRRIFPGRTIEVIGLDLGRSTELHYEVDHEIHAELERRPYDLTFELYLEDHVPVRGRVPFDQLNKF